VQSAVRQRVPGQQREETWTRKNARARTRGEAGLEHLRPKGSSFSAHGLIPPRSGRVRLHQGAQLGGPPQPPGQLAHPAVAVAPVEHVAVIVRSVEAETALQALAEPHRLPVHEQPWHAARGHADELVEGADGHGGAHHDEQLALLQVRPPQREEAPRQLLAEEGDARLDQPAPALPQALPAAPAALERRPQLLRRHVLRGIADDVAAVEVASRSSESMFWV